MQVFGGGRGAVGIKGKQGWGVVICSVISPSLLKPKFSSRFWGQGQWVAVVPYRVTREGKLMRRAGWRIRERRAYHTWTPL